MKILLLLSLIMVGCRTTKQFSVEMVSNIEYNKDIPLKLKKNIEKDLKRIPNAYFVYEDNTLNICKKNCEFSQIQTEDLNLLIINPANDGYPCCIVNLNNLEYISLGSHGLCSDEFYCNMVVIKNNGVIVLAVLSQFFREETAVRLIQVTKDGKFIPLAVVAGEIGITRHGINVKVHPGMIKVIGFDKYFFADALTDKGKQILKQLKTIFVCED